MLSQLLKRLATSLLLISPFAVFGQELVADFELSDYTVCPGSITEITNKSTREVTYIWQQGDAVTETVTDYNGIPKYPWPNSGKFRVKLIVKRGKDTVSVTKYVTVYKNPVANIQLPAVTCAPATLEFKSTSTPGDAPLKSYIWDFEDGNIISESTARRFYQSGSKSPFRVNFKVTDENGCSDTAIRTFTLYEQLQASFTAEPSFSCKPPLVSQITNTSTNAISATYEWTLSNGQAVTGNNPKITLTSLGDYTLSLVAKNAQYGCTSQAFSKAISVSNVKADFTISNRYYSLKTSSYVLETIADGGTGTMGNIILEDKSVGGNSAEWKVKAPDETDFKSIGEQMVACKPGTYIFKLLKIAGEDCKDSLEKQITIGGNSRDSIRIVQNSFNINNGKLSTDKFSVLSPWVASSYSWSFNGDTKTDYRSDFQSCKPGTYPIKLEASVSGCKLTTERTVTIEDLHKPSIILKDTLKTIDEKATVYTGWIKASLSDKAEKQTFTFDGQSYSTAEVKLHICTPGTYKIDATAEYSDKCPARITSRTFTVVDTSTPRLSQLYNETKNKVVGPNDVTCHEDILIATPAEGLTNVQMPTVGFTNGLPWNEAINGLIDTTFKIKRNLGTLKLVATMPNGCSDFAYIYLNEPSHHFSYNLESMTSVCEPNFEVTLNYVTKNIKAISWEYEVNNSLQTFAGDVTKSEYIIKPNNKDVFNPYAHAARDQGLDVTMFTIDNDGCSDSLSTYVPIGTAHGWFYPNKSSMCLGTPVTFTTYDDIGLKSLEEKTLWQLVFNTKTDIDFADLKASYDTVKIEQVVTKLIDEIKKDKLLLAAIDARFFNVLPSVHDLIDTFVVKVKDLKTIEDNTKRLAELAKLVDGFHSIIKYQLQHYSNIGKRIMIYGDGTEEVLSQPSEPEWNFVVNQVLSNCGISKNASEYTCGTYGSLLRTRNNYFTHVDGATSGEKSYRDSLEAALARYSKGLNPTHIYKKAGVYTVRYVVITEDGCKDTSAPVKIEVGQKLAVDFDMSKTKLCSNETLTLSSKTALADSIDWWSFSSDSANFSTSCPNSPTQTTGITANSAGKFDVTLTVGFNGCISTLTKKDALTVSGPQALFVWDMDCKSPYSYTFKPKMYEVANYSWDFGDGTSATAKSISAASKLDTLHTYSKSGDYTVKLTVENSSTGCPTRIYSVPVHVRKVTAGMSFVNPVLCNGIPITLKINNDPNDPKTSSDYITQKPTTVPAQIRPFLLYVDGKPYTNNPLNNALHDARAYTSEVNNSYTITPTTGKITLELTAYDENFCYDTARQTLDVKQLHAEIKLSRNFLCANNQPNKATEDTIHVSNPSTDTELTSWTWTFYDVDPLMPELTKKVMYGDAANNPMVKTYTFSPTAIYPQTKFIRIDAIDKWGCMDNTMESVTLYRPEAKVQIRDQVCTKDSRQNNKFVLEDQTANFDSVFWIIHRTANDYTSDASVLLKERVKDRVFTPDATERGTFYVTQTAYNKGCYDTRTHTATPITVKKVDATFTLNDQIIKQSQTVDAKLSTVYDADAATWTVTGGVPQTYNWVNNNPQTIPFAKYGAYQVGIEVTAQNTTDPTLSCVAESSLKVDVNGADMQVNDDKICVGETVTFQSLYQGNNNCTWNFGDGTSAETKAATIPVTHKYDKRGQFTVTLTSTLEGAVNDVQTKTTPIIVEQVSAKFTMPNNSGGVVCSKTGKLEAEITDPTDVAGGTWKLDSVERAYSPKFTQEFMRNETRTLRLHVESKNGCTDDYPETIVIKGPSGKMTISPKNVCINEMVTFNMIDTLDVDHFEWNLNGKPDSLNKKTTKSFDNIGSVTISLQLFDKDNCDINLYEKLYVREVKADFTTDLATICEGGSVSFTNNSKGDDIHKWTFGDNQNTNDKTPTPHSYFAAGEYKIGLYVEDNVNHCKDTASKIVSVKPTPSVSIVAKDSICYGDSIHLAVQYNADDKLEVTRDDVALTPAVAKIDEKIDQSALYKATVTTPFSCQNSAQHAVYVQQKPDQFVSPRDTSIIIGQLVTPVVRTPYKSKYTWTPATGLSCTDCPNPVMQPLDETTYKLTIQDNCFTNTHEIHFTIYPKASFDVPTTFTPNGDAKNDILMVRGWGVKELVEYSIYNRWGQKVFTTTNFNEGWDGTYNGEMQPIDTYAFYVKVNTFLGTSEEKKGYVTLAR